MYINIQGSIDWSESPDPELGFLIPPFHMSIRTMTAEALWPVALDINLHLILAGQKYRRL